MWLTEGRPSLEVNWPSTEAGTQPKTAPRAFLLLQSQLHGRHRLSGQKRGWKESSRRARTRVHWEADGVLLAGFFLSPCGPCYFGLFPTPLHELKCLYAPAQATQLPL
jgi:hypothetical protein